MTVCGKATETTNMNSPNRNLNSVNRPSFMITDILSKSSVDKALTTSHSEYLQHLERFSAMNGNRFGLNHGFGMPLPLPVNMDAADRKNNYCESDDDDFHGSDDVDGHSSDDGSNNDKDDDLNDSNQSNSLPSDRMSHKKQRKARTAFTDHQLHSMEKCFSRQKYLSVQDRMELANKLGISDTQVKTWFQNRRTKWKRQTSVGLELFVEAGNYAAYQRAYAQRYGQVDGLPSPYPTNPLMLPPATHSLLPQSGIPPTAIEGYYQQVLQNGMNGIAGPYGNMFGAPHRPLPMMHSMSNTNGFLPQGNFYSPSGLPSGAMPLPRPSPEHIRSNSISPVASSTSSHSPNTSRLTTTQSPPVQAKPAHTPSDDESDIEV